MKSHHGHGGHSCCHNHGRPATAGALIDPVCGMTVAPESLHEVSHDGADYVFCSAGCRTRFMADRTRYLTPDTVEAPELPVGT